MRLKDRSGERVGFGWRDGKLHRMEYVHLLRWFGGGASDKWRFRPDHGPGAFRHANDAFDEGLIEGV